MEVALLIGNALATDVRYAETSNCCLRINFKMKKKCKKTTNSSEIHTHVHGCRLQTLRSTSNHVLFHNSCTMRRQENNN